MIFVGSSVQASTTSLPLSGLREGVLGLPRDDGVLRDRLVSRPLGDLGSRVSRYYSIDGLLLASSSHSP